MRRSRASTCLTIQFTVRLVYLHYLIDSIIVIIVIILPQCLLNLHENERCKPAAWIPVGWLPSYIDARAKGLRPAKGYESIPARKMRLFHKCWIEFLDGWAERTSDAMILTWADCVQRSSRIFLGGLLGDRQEGDKFAGEPCVCHRCIAARKDYQISDAPAQAK